MNKNYLWIIVLIIIGVVTILIIYFLRNNSNTQITYCGPDKTDPVRTFVNPEQAFPAFATGYQVKLQAGVSLLDTLNKAASTGANAGSEIQTQIVELREKLNQDNIRMENLMRAIFYAYNGRPCNPEVSKRYFDMLDTLAYKITELEKLKASLLQPQKGNNSSDSILTSKEITNDSARVKKALRIFSNRVIKYDLIETQRAKEN